MWINCIKRMKKITKGKKILVEVGTVTTRCEPRHSVFQTDLIGTVPLRTTIVEKVYRQEM
jgi:hypothetical protein